MAASVVSLTPRLCQAGEMQHATSKTIWSAMSLMGRPGFYARTAKGDWSGPFGSVAEAEATEAFRQTGVTVEIVGAIPTVKDVLAGPY